MSEICINNLCKLLGGALILDRISITMHSGNIYGFVGRNGSGKTMLLRHICGLLHPTSGDVIINGKHMGKDIDLPQNIGAIIETPGFLPEYSGFQNLLLLSMIQRKVTKEKIREVLRIVGLDPDSRKHVRKYSMGMRQRLGIAQALMEDPDILLLDEPMNGLDNEGVEEMRRLFISLRDRGKLIIIASHSREDVGLLCDVIYQFDKGKIIES